MTLNARHFRVDFREDAFTRWKQLLENNWARGKARTLTRAISRQLPTPARVLLGKIATGIASLNRGELDYLEEIKAWSDLTVGDVEQVILANFSYELYHTRGGLGDWLSGVKRRFGFCTSVAFCRPGLGMIHARNVDWPLPQMKQATVILDCESSSGPFQAVSVPGMVGVLSGAGRSRFSITVNSKDDRNHYVPNLFGWGATLLVRWILENCETFEEALRELRKAPAFVPFYVMLVGLEPSQAVVVEINRDGRNRVHRPSLPMGLANHYPGEVCADEEMDSQERQECVQSSACQSKARSLRGCFPVVSEYPVMNSGTVQSMVMHPRTGKVVLQAV